MNETCRFCNTVQSVGALNCASYEQANKITKEHPFGCPWFDQGSRMRFAAPGKNGWRPMETAPKDQFIFLYCEEDGSRWLAKWQGQRWYGVDDCGLSREGSSLGDPDVVTGWFVTRWQPLPDAPVSRPLYRAPGGGE